MGLVELDLDDGSGERLEAAKARVEEMLSWMPENLDARTHLGVVLVRLGRAREAAAAYEEVLRRDPRHVTANLNLAELHRRAERSDRAARYFEAAAEAGPVTLAQAIALHDYFVDLRQTLRLPAMWERFNTRVGESVEGKAYLAWTHALVGNVPRAREVLADLGEGESATARAASIYTHLASGSFEVAWAEASGPHLSGPRAGRARRQLLAALQYFDSRNPNVAWTYCVAGAVLLADGNSEGAGLSAELCARHCHEEKCRRAVEDLRGELGRAARP
jgi:tetratricopeptide (TPR) repeat protein